MTGPRLTTQPVAMWITLNALSTWPTGSTTTRATPNPIYTLDGALLATSTDTTSSPPAVRASLLARYLQDQFRARCPDGRRAPSPASRRLWAATRHRMYLFTVTGRRRTDVCMTVRVPWPGPNRL